jgi:excinuclease UvrABC helicase subunit UvrB
MALASLDNLDPAGAVEQVELGAQQLLLTYAELGLEDEELENDEFLSRLRTMKLALSQQYQIEPSLDQQLAEAVAAEDYERAADLRDRIARLAK